MGGIEWVEMDSKVARQQSGKIAKKEGVCLEELLNMQDLTEGKRFEFRVLPLVGRYVIPVNTPPVVLTPALEKIKVLV